MSDNSVDSDQYVDGSIDLAHMSVNSIDSDQYVDGSIDTAHIANNAILTQHIDDNQITGDQLADDLVLSGTGALRMPDGTTGQRPGSPTAGMFRYNTTDTKFEGYTDSWGEIGGGGTNTFTRDAFTGDGSDTTFTLSQSISDENNLIVFIEGVFQDQDAYSVSGTTLTFGTAPVNGRGIIVYSVNAAVSGNNLNIDTMTGDNSDTTLALSVTPVSENNTQVFIDGVYQSKSGYSTSGTTLTFSTAPPTGALVECMTFTQTDINQPTSGSVVTASIAADAVTGAKIADDAIDSEHYTDASIDTAHIADNQVTLAKMAGITRGSIIIGNASGNPAALAIGTNDYVLTSDGTDLAWEAASGAVTALNNATANEVVTVGSTTTELDAESTMTFDGETLYVVGNNDPRDVLHLNNSANANSDLVFRNKSNSWNIKGDQAVTLQSGASGAGADYLVFYTNGGSNERMRIAENGWVTIGTSARINQNAITSSSAAVAWDAQAAANAYHLTTENTTFSAPSNATEGQIISVEIAQGGTARTIAWNTVFEFAASTAPTITATASKTDILTFRYNGSVWQEIGRVQNMAQT